MTNNTPVKSMNELMAQFRQQFERGLIGADKIFETYFTNALGAYDNYPPRNIEKLGADQYRITLAVAGFTKDELSIVKEGCWLTIAGEKKDKEVQSFIFHGIAARSFSNRVLIAPDIEVDGAVVENGLLHINLHRAVPESEKPQTIKIK